MVAICFDMDLGDSWEHADNPEYPQKFSALGIRIGVNYVSVRDDALSRARAPCGVHASALTPAPAIGYPEPICDCDNPTGTAYVRLEDYESTRSIGICKEKRCQADRSAIHRYPEPAASRFLPDQRTGLDSFEEGFGMDGSSIRGWAAINESDMLLIPDPTTAIMDPFAETPTLVMIGDVKDPVTKQRYERDPRWIAKKAEMYLKNSGIADTAYFGAEAEFFIFDNVSFDQNQHSGFYFIDADDGRWNSGRGRTISGIGRGTRKATSRFRPPIITRTSAARWSRP